MPQGKTHDIITAVTTPIVAGISYYYCKDIKTVSTIVGLFLFSSLMFNGDLDIESAPYNRWLLLKYVWIPYQKIFHHRSLFTHGLIIGTIVRIIYLGIVPILIIFINGNIDNYFQYLNLQQLLIIFIGLELGSAVHTISDYVL